MSHIDRPCRPEGLTAWPWPSQATRRMHTHARTERAALVGCRMLLAERLATKADDDDVMSENERLKEELRCLQVGPHRTQSCCNTVQPRCNELYNLVATQHTR